MRVPVTHRRMLCASLRTRQHVTRSYSRWSQDDMGKSEQKFQRPSEDKHPLQKSRFRRQRSQDLEVQHQNSSEPNTFQQETSPSRFSDPNIQDEDPGQFDEYRHRKHRRRSHSLEEEGHQNGNEQTIFGPRDRERIDYFSLAKKVYSTPDHVEATQEALEKAQASIEDLEKRAFQSLQRVETKDGRVVYSRKRQDKLEGREIKDGEIFEISPALMDLDSWNNPRVRLFDDSDEAAQVEKWSQKPRWEGVKTFVDDLEARVLDSKKLFDTLLNERHNPSRINAWDLVSMALRGSNTDLVVTQSSGSPVENTSRHLDPRGNGDVLPQIIHENGIPQQFKDRDSRLIEWMLMRKRRTDKEGGRRSRTEQLPVFRTISSTTVAGLRRGVTGMLDAGLYDSSKIHVETSEMVESSLRNQLQRSALALSKPNASDLSAHVSLLCFVGNLFNRSMKKNPEFAAHLAWLGIRLASLHDARTVLYHVDQASRFVVNHKASPTPNILERIMQEINLIVGDVSDASWSTRDPELVSQFLEYYTGSSHDGSLNTEVASFRAVIMQRLASLQDDDTKASQWHKRHAEMWLFAYQNYLRGLGHLGAVRSIWEEWNSSRKLFVSLVDVLDPKKREKLHSPFIRAVEVLLKQPTGSPELDDHAVHSALEGSLEGWLEFLDRHGWQNTHTYGQQAELEQGTPALSSA